MEQNKELRKLFDAALDNYDKISREVFNELIGNREDIYHWQVCAHVSARHFLMNYKDEEIDAKYPLFEIFGNDYPEELLDMALSPVPADREKAKSLFIDEFADGDETLLKLFNALLEETTNIRDNIQLHIDRVIKEYSLPKSA